MQFRQFRRTDPEQERTTEFGAAITLDHVITLHPDAACFDGMVGAVIVKDRATGWVEVFQIRDHSTEATAKALETLLAPGEEVVKVWGDGSGEVKGACDLLDWPLQQSTPGRPQSNGVAERALRACLEGTRTVLEQAGLNRKWWSRAARHFTLVCTCTAKDENGTIARSRRHNSAPAFPITPSGCKFHYESGAKRHNAGEDTFGPSSSKGFFMGC
jgi:hypothetical protein